MTNSQPAAPLREALNVHDLGAIGSRYNCGCGEQFTNWTRWADHREAAVRAALGDHATLGLVWASVEAALPEGWICDGVVRLEVPVHPWLAICGRRDFDDGLSAHGPTPEAALLALLAALTEKKP